MPSRSSAEAAVAIWDHARLTPGVAPFSGPHRSQRELPVMTRDDSSTTSQPDVEALTFSIPRAVVSTPLTR